MDKSVNLTATQKERVEAAAFALRLALCTDKRWIARALRRLPADRRKDALIYFVLSGANLDYVMGMVRNAIQDAAEEALTTVIAVKNKTAKMRRNARREPGYGRAVGL